MDVEPLEASPSNHMNYPASPETDIDSDDSCIICLQRIVDRTVLQCTHDQFCFECAIIWTKQSRKCPLCSVEIGTYVIHEIRSQYDYQKYYLPPLNTPLETRHALQAQVQANVRRRQRPIQWGRQNGHDEADSSNCFERAVEKRRWVYKNKLYAKHVASNSYTKHRPYPTPAQFNTSEELMSRVTAFIRRELQVWVNLDIQFLTTFFVSLLRSMDLRSEPAVRAIAEFLDLGGEQYREGDHKDNAEHFAHELYSYIRSPYRDLSVYDSVVQYDKPFEYRYRNERSFRGGSLHSPRMSSIPPLPRRPRNQSRSYCPAAEPHSADRFSHSSSPSGESSIPIQKNLLADVPPASHTARRENAESVTDTNEPPRKMQGRVSTAPASNNLSRQDRQLTLSGTIFEAVGDTVSGNKREQPSQGHGKNVGSARSNLSSPQIIANYESNLAILGNEDTVSSGPNFHQLGRSQGRDPPRQLSIRNAARRLRANVTRMDDSVPQESTRNCSSISSLASPNAPDISGEPATGEGAIVSAPSQPALDIEPDRSHCRLVARSVKSGENSNFSDVSATEKGTSLSSDSHVIVVSDTKKPGATQSFGSSIVHGNEARLRLLRARIAAAKELERSLTTNNANSNNDSVSSRAAPHETDSGVSLPASTRTNTLAARGDSTAPGAVASGDILPETREKPLLLEEAALRQILLQRRASTAAGDAAARS